jgi:hypothetical protein
VLLPCSGFNLESVKRINLVKRERHDSVGEVESFLDAVAVVNVDVDIQDAWVHLKRLGFQHKTFYCHKKYVGLGLLFIIILSYTILIQVSRWCLFLESPTTSYYCHTLNS